MFDLLKVPTHKYAGNALLLWLPIGKTKLPVSTVVLVVMVTLIIHVRQSSCAASVNYTDRAEDILPRTWHQDSGGKLKSCNGIHVEIVISPQISNLQHDQLVLYWEATTILPDDKVVLYDHDPNENPDDPLHIELVDTNRGWVVTDVSEGQNSSVPTVFTKICLGYWIAYIRGDSGVIAASSCLSTEPRWMEESWYAISRLSLANIFVPGTHNSASFKESYSPVQDNIIYKYTYNQEISVLNQLLWGVRALDLRIAYYPESKEIWWCNHDFIRVQPLKQVINDIKLFLNNTQEIIILDVHNFPVGFSTDDSTEVHKKLLSYLQNELVDYLAPASLGWAASLSDLKRSGKQAILAYNSYEASNNYTWIPVQQRWGNVQTLKKFVQFFERLFETPVMSPWAAMVQLTPRAIDVLLNTLGGLRHMAAVVNPTITSWFNGEWGRVCHIVHCDFIRGTGIVKAAIKWNLKRAGYHNHCELTVS